MIKRLMELGVIVEPEAVGLLEKGDADSIAEHLLKMRPMPLTINAELAKKLLAEDAKPKLLKRVSEMKEMSMPDFAAGYNERYSALQRLLLKNPALGGAVSIASATGECSIIGMVKNGGKTIEDPSGEGTLVADAKLYDGDVIGAIGTAANGVFKAREIFFPNVQLKERREACGTVTAGAGGDIKTDATAFYDVNGAVIAVSHAILSKEEALELLKRRHLTVPPKDVLEPQPDILIFNSKENFTETFKGILLVGIKDGTRAEIDVGARGARFAQL
ncbi:MAG: hypothetical protein QXD77_03425 [Candidatus Aenigmatarchaeota archaeon]